VLVDARHGCARPGLHDAVAVAGKRSRPSAASGSTSCSMNPLAQSEAGPGADRPPPTGHTGSSVPHLTSWGGRAATRRGREGLRDVPVLLGLGTRVLERFRSTGAGLNADAADGHHPPIPRVRGSVISKVVTPIYVKAALGDLSPFATRFVAPAAAAVRCSSARLASRACGRSARPLAGRAARAARGTGCAAGIRYGARTRGLRADPAAGAAGPSSRAPTAASRAAPAALPSARRTSVQLAARAPRGRARAVPGRAAADERPAGVLHRDQAASTPGPPARASATSRLGSVKDWVVCWCAAPRSGSRPAGCPPWRRASLWPAKPALGRDRRSCLSGPAPAGPALEAAWASSREGRAEVPRQAAGRPGSALAERPPSAKPANW
jgi:hypothetical protein